MTHKKPRSYHDLDKQMIGNPYQQLSHVRDIVSTLMDDLYEQRLLQKIKNGETISVAETDFSIPDPVISDD